MSRPALIFDLDGTLSDPREGIIRCIRSVLESFAVEVPSDADLEQYIGPPLNEAFAAMLGGESAAEAVRRYRECYALGGLYENHLYPGMDEALRVLRGLAPRMLIATSKPRQFADRIIERFGLSDCFHAIYGCSMTGELSDKTELVSHLLRSERLAAADAVLIGDRKHDVIAARAHGIRSVGVTWGFGSAAELTTAGADQLCASVSELVDWYRGANGGDAIIGGGP